MVILSPCQDYELEFEDLMEFPGLGPGFEMELKPSLRIVPALLGQEARVCLLALPLSPPLKV